MKNRKKYVKYVGQFLTLLLVLGVLCCFVAKKEGYHMDELLCFELSNAQYNPWIVPTQPVGRLAKFMKEEIQGDSIGETFRNLVDVGMDVVKNRGNSRLLQYKADVYPEPVWISGEQFTDYVTVNKGERFQYFSVYFNVKDDNHPPLHFMLLHTMCSLFPGVVAPFLGDIINIFAILGCIFCFFRLGDLLEAHEIMPQGCGKVWGISAGILYGVSVGGIRTALLIRMYGLVTFWCVLLFYLHVKKWLEQGFGSRNKLLAVVTMLGFWTQYFFLYYCLALAAVTVGLFIARKRIPELKRYIRAMLAAAVIGVALFPFAVADVFSSGRGVEALQNLGSGLSGYGYRLGMFAGILAESSFGSIGFGIVVLICLAGGVCIGRVKKRRVSAGRESSAAIEKESANEVGSAAIEKGSVNEEGSAVLEKESANEEGSTVLEKESVKGAAHGHGRSSRDGRKAILLMLLLPVICYFLLAVRTAPYLVDRYLMPLFPFAAMLLTLLAGIAFGVFGKVGQAGGTLRICQVCMIGLVCLIGAVNLATYDGTYLYQGYDRQLQIAQEYKELPCICLYDGTGYYENLLEFTQYERTLLLKLPELEQRQDTSDLTQIQELVVLKKGIIEEEAALAALEQYGWKVERVLLSEEESVHRDTVYMCRKVAGSEVP